jgi:hypothetical protein
MMKKLPLKQLALMTLLLVLGFSSCATKKEDPTLEQLLAGFEVGDPGSGEEGKILLMAYKGNKKGHKRLEFTLNSKKVTKNTTLISVFSFKKSSQYKKYASDIQKKAHFPHTIEVSLSPKLFDKNTLKVGVKIEFGLYKETAQGLKKISEKVLEMKRGTAIKDSYQILLSP